MRLCSLHKEEGRGSLGLPSARWDLDHKAALRTHVRQRVEFFTCQKGLRHLFLGLSNLYFQEPHASKGKANLYRPCTRCRP